MSKHIMTSAVIDLDNFKDEMEVVHPDGQFYRLCSTSIALFTQEEWLEERKQDVQKVLVVWQWEKMPGHL